MFYLCASKTHIKTTYNDVISNKCVTFLIVFKKTYILKQVELAHAGLKTYISFFFLYQKAKFFVYRSSPDCSILRWRI